jgi:hypothetical protein
MTSINKFGFKGIVSAIALLASSTAFAQTFEQRTETSIKLGTVTGAYTTLLKLAVPAGIWVATAKASVVNWGDSDYVRCGLITDATFVDGSTSMIGEAGGAPAVATLYNQSLFIMPKAGSVSFACSHDFPIEGEFVDPGASLIITAASSKTK